MLLWKCLKKARSKQFMFLKWLMFYLASQNNYQLMVKFSQLICCVESCSHTKLRLIPNFLKQSCLHMGCKSISWLADLVDVKMSKKSQIKTINFFKMINVSFSIPKQLPTVIMVKLSRLICCVESCSHTKLRLIPNFVKQSSL